MKVNYRHNSNKQRHTKQIVWTAIVVVLGVLLTHVLFGSAASAGYRLVTKIDNWLFATPDSIPGYLQDKASLIAEIESLRSQLAGFDGNRVTIAHLQAENDTLRQRLSVASTSQIFASVIGRPPQVAYDALLLDVGFTQGVVEGAVVYLGAHQAIGTVVRSFADSSVVKLFSSPDVNATAFLIGPDVYADTQGLGGGVLEVSVPQGVSLAVGDLVVLPAVGAGVYGEVEEVVSVPTEPVQYGYVTIGTALSSVRTVSVGTDTVRAHSYEEIEDIVRAATLDVLQVTVPDALRITPSTTTPTTTAEIATTSATTTP